MLTVSTALERILANLPPPTPETAPVGNADGRVLLASCAAATDLPGFDNSSMDGFAVRSCDIRGASLEHPVCLGLQDRVPAGSTPARALQPGACARVFTGSPIPEGADAVVMQEDTRTDPANPNAVLILDRVRPWENVRIQGEDVRRGEPLVSAGELITPVNMGLLAACGIDTVLVGRRPRVAVLATGSELREPGTSLQPGEIYESNRHPIAALVRRAGAVADVRPPVVDTLQDTRRAMESALGESDFLVTCGGVSVGEFDHAKAAFESLGGTIEFWRIAMRPGKPFVCGTLGAKRWFGLPGNPVSAMVTCALLVRPALLRAQGAREVALPTTTGVLGEPMNNPGDRAHFARVRFIDGKVHLSGKQASHTLRSLGISQGLLEVPPLSTLPEGAPVTIHLWP